MSSSLQERIQKLPKVELHLHLDGSLSQHYIQQ
jgi:adenosine deaminase